MGQLVSTKIFGAIRGLFSALDVSDETLLKDTVTRRTLQAHVTDGGTAGTAQTETPLWKNTTATNQRVAGAIVTTPVAVTASDTTNATFTVTRRDAAGINAVVVATVTTNVAGGNYTAFLPVALALTAANVIVGPGQVLTVLVSKLSTGVAIAAATSQARIEVLLEPSD